MTTSQITITAEGANVPTLSGRIFEPRVGVWYAEVEVSGDKVPSGAAVLSIYDQIEFGGTVSKKRTAVDNGRLMLRLDAGSGDLDEIVKSQSFRKTTVGDILNALVFQTGDAIDPDPLLDLGRSVR